ncbi:hypothetical protein D3C74_440140 [compost metagenome]
MVDQSILDSDGLAGRRWNVLPVRIDPIQGDASRTRFFLVHVGIGPELVFRVPSNAGSLDAPKGASLAADRYFNGFTWHV